MNKTLSLKEVEEFQQALYIVKRWRTAIAITNKFGIPVSKDDFYLHWLLIHGHWRSDFEILANQPSYREASVYHGLSEPSDDSNETVFLKDFIMKVVIDSRYSTTDIARLCMFSNKFNNSRN